MGAMQVIGSNNVYGSLIIDFSLFLSLTLARVSLFCGLPWSFSFFYFSSPIAPSKSVIDFSMLIFVLSKFVPTNNLFALNISNLTDSSHPISSCLLRTVSDSSQVDIRTLLSPPYILWSLPFIRVEFSFVEQSLKSIDKDIVPYQQILEVLVSFGNVGENRCDGANDIHGNLNYYI